MYKLLIVASVIICIGFNAVSQVGIQNRDILFRNISNKDGLSQSTVWSIAQDSLGYMWFATQDGLNRFDGNDFRIYRNNMNEKGGILSKYIRKVYVDRKGVIWVGGNKGISRYDYVHDEFENYVLFKNYYDRYVSDIVEDRNGVVWVGSYRGSLFYFDPDNNEFKDVKLSYQGEGIYSINDIYFYNDKLLIGTEYGLFSFDKQGSQLTKINFFNGDIKVRALLSSTDGGLWVGTEGQGLFLLSPGFQVKTNLRHELGDDNSLCNSNVRSLSYDKEGNLWIGTFVGLSIFNPHNRKFVNCFHDNTRFNSLSQNSIRSIYRDVNGGMWLGTFYGGVDFYHPANVKFNFLNQNGGALSLNDNVVSAMKEDRKGNVWIATNDKGLNYWDRRSKTVSYFEHSENNPNSLSSNNIKSIVALDDGKLLIGTHNAGLNYFDPINKRNTLFKYNGKPGTISDNNVYALLKDHKSRIWVGTWKGLDQFNPGLGVFNHVNADSKGERLVCDEVSFLYEDSKNRIWIGTFDGLSIYYPDKNLFESFKNQPSDSTSLSNNTVNCIFEDRKGRVWIGTDEGLNIFDEIERCFKRYSTNHGLPNDVIYGILEDDKARLWISTNMGLSCFDPATKSFRNYDSGDGLQNRQFNTYSSCRLSDGTFLFGGIKGLTYFRPETIDEGPFNSEILLTQLRVNNSRVVPGDKSSILKQHVNLVRKIVLKSNQNTVALRFAAINYIGSSNVYYLHKLENYEDNWIRSSIPNVSYSNLPSGKYTFKVKAVNGIDGNEGKLKEINIVVAKPWYRSTLAIIIYLLILAVIVHLLMKFIRERIKTLHELRIERLEKEKLNEINQLKLQFFTNITHEFRTPLTLILSPLEKIIEKPIHDEWLKKQILLINKNAKRLLNLIDQLMDFRKTEMGKLELKASKGELISFINDIYLSFAAVASQNNIIYTFRSEEDKIEVYFDKNVIEKIVFNLLSNAFKFTPSGGTIGINLSKTTKWVHVEIADSGKGIAKDKISLIFERYYSVDESHKHSGTGIGLALAKRLVELHHGSIKVESEEGNGSKFIVKLPVNENVFSGDELCSLDVQVGGHVDSLEVIPEDFEDETMEDSLQDEKETILIVEDNIEIVNYLKETLSETYNVLSASNGEEALQYLETINPDLIISDIMMAVMDGIKLCRKIKQNIKTAHIPVILLTAKSSVEDQLVGYDAGADDYVAKPFTISILEAKIKNIIRSRKRMKDYYSRTIEIMPDEIAFNPLDREILEKSKAIVEKYLTDADFSVETFAREIGMSRSNLHLKLKAITGESATDFIKKVRFGKAVKLLEENRYSISEISYMVGFNSPSYFTTSFKKYFGYLPTEYLSHGKDMPANH